MKKKKKKNITRSAVIRLSSNISTFKKLDLSR